MVPSLFSPNLVYSNDAGTELVRHTQRGDEGLNGQLRLGRTHAGLLNADQSLRSLMLFGGHARHFSEVPVMEGFGKSPKDKRV